MSVVRSSPKNFVPPVPAASTAAGNSLSDISEYLKDIPLDWLSDAANLLNHTLQFNCLTPNLSSSNGSSAGVDDGEVVSAIVRGAKQVRVPPGECCSSLKTVRCFRNFIAILWYHLFVFKSHVYVLNGVEVMSLFCIW